MKYTKIEILKELKHIKKCHKNTPNVRDCMDISANCIYTDTNIGILNYLEENKYILMQNSQYSGRRVPFITSYGNDFLKRNNILNCFIQDNQWSINIIIGIIITIIVSLIIWHYTTNIIN